MTNEIDLRQLRYFAAVAEQLSFGKAAKVLHISQPPLSRQIRSLETSLGVVLLNRSHQGVSLTPAGMVFLSEIRQILQRVEQARVLAKRAEYGQAGELKVGYCSYLDTVLNSFLAARFRGESELRLRSHSLPSSDQVELLRNRILDVGIVHLPLPDTDHLTVELLCHEPIVAMVARDHPLSARRRVSLVDLGKQEILVPRRQSFPLVHHQIHRVCVQANLKAQFVDPQGCYDDLVHAARHNGKIALVPSAVKYARSGLKGVRFIGIDESYASLNVGVLYRRDQTSPVLARFLETVRRFPMDFEISEEQAALATR